jgi:Holliday junction resolvase RusA-like endonuclease
MSLKSLLEVEESGYPEYIKEQLRRGFTEKKNRNRTSSSTSNLELSTKRKSVRKNESAAFNSPVRINIYSTRKRKTDIDGISGKAALDGIVNSGLLIDDSSDQIESYQVHKPTICNEEKTLIIIEEI